MKRAQKTRTLCEEIDVWNHLEPEQGMKAFHKQLHTYAKTKQLIGFLYMLSLKQQHTQVLTDLLELFMTSESVAVFETLTYLSQAL